MSYMWNEVTTSSISCFSMGIVIGTSVTISSVDKCGTIKLSNVHVLPFSALFDLLFKKAVFLFSPTLCSRISNPPAL